MGSGFIEVTWHGANEKSLININQIVSVDTQNESAYSPGMAKIWTTDGNSCVVDQSYDEIKNKIEEAT